MPCGATPLYRRACRRHRKSTPWSSCRLHRLDWAGGMSLLQEGEAARHVEIIEPHVSPSEVVSLRPVGRRHDGEETGPFGGPQADGGIFEGDAGAGRHVEGREGVDVNVRSRLLSPHDIACRNHIEQVSGVLTARRFDETI